MGQSSTSPNLNPNPTLLSSYHELDTKCDYGTILSHKLTKETYLLKEINMPHQQDFKRTLKLLQTKKQQTKENVLNLVHIESQSKSMFCSEIYRISLVFEFTNITLFQEIEARQPELRYFDELDLWSILQSCLCGLVEIGQNIILQPSRVYIMNEGLIKIIDPEILSSNNWLSSDQNIFYSPERFQNLGNLTKISTTEEEAMFSLGMTLLNTALLEGCIDCYDYENRRFNDNKLQEKIGKIQELYSKDLRALLAGVLEVDPANRMGMMKMQEIVAKVIKQVTEEQEQEQEQQQQQEQEQQHCYEASRVQGTQHHSYGKNEKPLKDIQNYQRGTHVTNTSPSIKTKQTEIPTKIDPSATNYQTYSYKEQNTLTYISYRQQGSPDAKLETLKTKNVYEKSIHFEPSNAKDNTSFYKTQRDRDRDEDLFTDPKLMEQIRRDISEITARRSLLPTNTAPNCNSGYTPQPEKIASGSQRLVEQKQELHYEEDGKVFEGRLVNGRKEGHGRLSYPEGPFYLGNFHNDKMHGRGALHYQEGKPAYDGEWFEDQFHGFGTLYNENPVEQHEPFDFTDFNMVEDFWIKYEGQFVRDNKEGLGRLYLSNGESFEGHFYRDYINGGGCFLDQFGEKYEGKWDNNILEEKFSQC